MVDTSYEVGTNRGKRFDFCFLLVNFSFHIDTLLCSQNLHTKWLMKEFQCCFVDHLNQERARYHDFSGTSKHTLNVSRSFPVKQIMMCLLMEHEKERVRRLLCIYVGCLNLSIETCISKHLHVFGYIDQFYSPVISLYWRIAWSCFLLFSLHRITCTFFFYFSFKLWFTFLFSSQIMASYVNDSRNFYLC